jgi:D-glycero-D-manno-heptose 1,7-bisphosphate phosphatase
MIKAIFWDRDGVLNHVLGERKEDGQKNVSPLKFEDFKLVDGVADVLMKVKEKGYMNVIATKQPDIARSKMSWEELNKMHDFLKERAPTIDAIYVCPHDNKDNCNCRKPKPGLLLDAAKDYHLNLSECFMVGDSQSDIDAAHNAGVKAIVFRTHYNQEITNADFEVKNLNEVLNLI